MEKGSNMCIKWLSLGTVAIDVSSEDEFFLALYSNIIVSNKFDA